MAEKKVIEIEIKDNISATQDHFNDLRNEIKKTEKEVEDLTKTYGENSDAVKKSEKQLDSLKGSYTELSKSATDLGATFEDIYGEIKPLTAQMGEAEDRLYQLALAGETATQEYKDLLESVGAYRRLQIQTDLAVDNAAGTLDQKLGGALQGAASGLSAVQGAMASFGAESEEVEEALLKVQSAMALSEGVKGIREAIPSVKMLGSVAVKAFQGMRGAILATGIGALVVALGFLVANFDKVKDAISRVSAKQKVLNDVTATAIDNVAKELSASDKLQRTLNDESKTRDEKVKAVKKLQEEYPDLLSNIDAEKNSLQEINKALKLNTQLTIVKAQLDAIAELRAESLKEAIKGQVDAQTGANVGALDYVLAMGDANKAQIIAQGSSQKLQREKQKEINVFDNLTDALEKQQAALEKKGAVTKKVDKIEKVANDNANNRAEEAKRRAEEARKIEEERLRNILELEREYKDKIEAIAEENFQNSLTEQERELQAIEEKYFTILELAKDNAEDLAIVEQAKEFELKAIRDKALEEEEEKRKEIREKNFANDQLLKEIQAENDEKEKIRKEKEIADAKAVSDAKVDIALNGLTLISDLSNLFADKSEKDAERAFNVNKAVGIAQTIISTYQAAQAAYASQLTIPSPDAPIRGAVAAGIAIASGLARVAAIGKTKFQSGSVSTPSVSDSGGGGNSVTAPNFNVVGNNGQNQLNQLNQAPIQAFVVSGEVTSAQSLDRNRIQNATL